MILQVGVWLQDLPISRVHQMVLKQSALLLCDLLILPSFILVRLTCYRRAWLGVFLGVEKVLLKSTLAGVLFLEQLKNSNGGVERCISNTPPSFGCCVFLMNNKILKLVNIFCREGNPILKHPSRSCINLGFLEFILKHSLGKKSGQSHRYPCIAENSFISLLRGHPQFMDFM